MAEVIVGAAITAAAGAAGIAAGVTTISAVALSVGTTVAAAGLSYVMKPDPVTGTPAAATALAAPSNGQRSLVVRQAVPARRFVYGKCRTGGVLFFEDIANPFLVLGSLLSDQTIESIEAVYFGELNFPLVNSSGTYIAPVGHAYRSYYGLRKSLGGTSQTRDAKLYEYFPYLDDTFIQYDIARAVSILGYGADITNHSELWGGSIEPVYLIKGVKVYDPRDAAQVFATRSTWVYSDNPALCIAHALTNVWSTSLAYADINWSSVTTAANVCDTTLSYAGSTVKTFTLAGVFEAGTDVASQLAAMLGAMGGAITFDDGVYSIHADAAKTSVWTVTDNDIFEIGEIKHDIELADLYGSISAEYFAADDAGKQNITPTYTVDSAGRKTTISVPFAAATHSAQILAYRQLIRARTGGEFTITLSDAALWLTPFADLITISSTAIPIINGDYEVVQIDLQQYGAAVKLRAYNSAVYAAPSGYLV